MIVVVVSCDSISGRWICSSCRSRSICSSGRSLYGSCLVVVGLRRCQVVVLRRCLGLFTEECVHSLFHLQALTKNILHSAFASASVTIAIHFFLFHLQALTKNILHSAFASASVTIAIHFFYLV